MPHLEKDIPHDGAFGQMAGESDDPQNEELSRAETPSRRENAERENLPLFLRVSASLRDNLFDPAASHPRLPSCLFVCLRG
jgi:hypothetical protein